MNRARLFSPFKFLAVFLLAGYLNGNASTTVSVPDTLLLLSDSLSHHSVGDVTGGTFMPEGGWKVSEPNSMIFYDLGTYITNGILEITVANFDPQVENTFRRHHVLSMYTNQWGEHHQIELLNTDWNFHTGFNYFDGVKLQSATYEENKQVILPRSQLSWDIHQTYRLKFVWQSDTVRFFRNDTLLIKIGQSHSFLLRYIFLGRDRTISGDYFTDYEYQQYPAMVGPIFSDLVVKKIIADSSNVSLKMNSFKLVSRYANAARLKWELSSKGISQLIYRSVGSVTWDSTAILGPPRKAFEYSIGGLAPAENYEARVILFNDDGSTNVSSPVYFQTTDSGIYLFKPKQDSFTEDVGIIGPYRNIANMGWLYLMTGKSRNTFLLFPSFPGGKIPNRASLRMHIRNKQGTISDICVSRVYSPWKESSITWESQPQIEDSCLSEVRGDNLMPGTWLTIPLHLESFTDSTLNLALTTRDTGWVSFDSRESLANQPELILDYGSEQRVKIELFSPPPNYKTRYPILNVSGKVSDSDVISVTINGTLCVPNDDSTFAGQIHLHEGGNLIQVTAVDFFGDVTQDTLFVTLDTTPPSLVNQSVPLITASSATLSWDTNEPSRGFVSYGLSTGREDTLRMDSSFTTSHKLNLINLIPKSDYKYYIYVSDSLGNLGVWGPYDFVTKEANQLKVSLTFDYFGDSTKVIDRVLVNFYADGQKVKVDTAANGSVNESNVIFKNTCELNWVKSDSLSSNSAIHMYDAALTALYSIGRMQLDSLQRIAADVDVGGSITMYDAAQIARFSVGLSVPKSSHVGQWKFLPDSLVITSPETLKCNCRVTGILLGDVHKDWQSESHLVKTVNSPGDKWVAQQVTLNRDTLVINIPLNVGDKRNHFSFLANVDYGPADLKFLGYSEYGSTKINIFQNPTQSGLKIGGFSTRPINGNSVRLRFLNGAQGNSVKIQGLRVLIDGEKIIDAAQINVEKEKRPGPHTFELFQNYPNPFNGNTQIQYVLPQKGWVTLVIFNQRGEAVKHILKKEMPAGMHKVFWNGTNDLGRKISSGLYFMRLTYNGQQKITKLLYIK
ncbi:MAG: DNRLRE domain-containing protein [Calditrichaeota bacterium]|nr:DNRLRE domain-containing protein [Calditrichota bacterium]